MSVRRQIKNNRNGEDEDVVNVTFCSLGYANFPTIFEFH